MRSCIAAGLVGGEGFAVDASLIAADANKQRSIAGQDWRRDRDPARSSRAVKEYLATLDDTAWGAASDVVPKFVSPSDPAAQWTGAHKGPAFFAYSDNYLIDVKFGVIVDVEASRAIRQAEVGAAKTMKSVSGSQFSATKRSSDCTSETVLLSRYFETTKPNNARQTLSASKLVASAAAIAASK